MWNVVCFKQTRGRAGMLKGWFDFVSSADIVNLVEEISSLCKIYLFVDLITKMMLLLKALNCISIVWLENESKYP